MTRSFLVSFWWKMTLSDANSSVRVMSNHFTGVSDGFNAGLTGFNFFYPETAGSDTHLQLAAHV